MKLFSLNWTYADDDREPEWTHFVAETAPDNLGQKKITLNEQGMGTNSKEQK